MKREMTLKEMDTLTDKMRDTKTEIGEGYIAQAKYVAKELEESPLIDWDGDEVDDQIELVKKQIADTLGVSEEKVDTLSYIIEGKNDRELDPYTIGHLIAMVGIGN